MSDPVECLRRINAAWLEGRPQDMARDLHPDVVMAFPGFGGRVAGRAALLAGFDDICRNARVHAFEASDWQTDVAGSVAVVSFAFTMDYERAGARWHSTGRDLWALERQGGVWRAVWRTMFDVREEPAR